MNGEGRFEHAVATRLIVEQEVPTRVKVRLQSEVWDGFEEIGAIEIDVARHLDARISIHVHRFNQRKTGRIEVSVE